MAWAWGAGQKTLNARARVALPTFCEISKVWLIELVMIEHSDKPSKPYAEE